MNGPRQWAIIFTAESEQDAERIADRLLDEIGYTGAPLDFAGGAAVAVPLPYEATARAAAEQVKEFTGLDGHVLTVDRMTFGEAALRRTERVGGFDAIVARSAAAVAKRMQDG